MATHSSTLALKIRWMEELGAGYYPWGLKESGMTERLTLSLSLFRGLESSSSHFLVCLGTNLEWF